MLDRLISSSLRPHLRWSWISSASSSPRAPPFPCHLPKAFCLGRIFCSPVLVCACVYMCMCMCMCIWMCVCVCMCMRMCMRMCMCVCVCVCIVLTSPGAHPAGGDQECYLSVQLDLTGHLKIPPALPPFIPPSLSILRCSKTWHVSSHSSLPPGTFLAKFAPSYYA